MRREEHNLARLPPTLDDRPDHLLGLRIDAVERLIEQQDVGALGQCPGHKNSLLLTP